MIIEFIVSTVIGNKRGDANRGRVFGTGNDPAANDIAGVKRWACHQTVMTGVFRIRRDEGWGSDSDGFVPWKKFEVKFQARFAGLGTCSAGVRCRTDRGGFSFAKASKDRCEARSIGGFDLESLD